MVDAFEESLKSRKNGKGKRKNVTDHTQEQQPNENNDFVEMYNEENDPKLCELKETTNNGINNAVQQNEVGSTSNPATVLDNINDNIVKILRVTHYSPPDNNFKDILINFLVLRLVTLIKFQIFFLKDFIFIT
ncbi:hypothetical protein Lalb_Chr17g0336231 [Lupinus albus]|uniref:Uncharacterized protein n=1 Tax=Lupinus albus TaxID=3870 RepID=A0A6A4P4M4_LUPAL|nr:hypothetical protein Lalb_Chr17g0336231 [Lupinus albus]